MNTLATDSNSSRLKAVEHVIYGNGKDGLITEIRLLQQDISRLIEIEKERSKKEWAILSSIVILMLSTLMQWM